MSNNVILGDINSYIEDNIGYIILDNPNRLNAISLSMWEKIGTSLITFEDDKNLRDALSVAPNIKFMKYEVSFKLVE